MTKHTHKSSPHIVSPHCLIFNLLNHVSPGKLKYIVSRNQPDSTKNEPQGPITQHLQEKIDKPAKIHSKCTPILQPKNPIRSYLGSEPYQRPKHENRIHRWNSERETWKHQASCRRRHLSKQASSFLLS